METVRLARNLMDYYISLAFYIEIVDKQDCEGADYLDYKLFDWLLIF